MSAARGSPSRSIWPTDQVRTSACWLAMVMSPRSGCHALAGISDEFAALPVALATPLRCEDAAEAKRVSGL
eukprot:3467396-Alexandrium_andersonii.AAC.1